MTEGSESGISQPVLVLVVEDEALIQLLVEQTLSEAGFQVVLAHNGERGITLLQEERSSPIRALLTDVDLGKGMSGWELARQARQLHPEIPVVYFTGGGAEEWSAQGVPHSILVTKPFVPAQLVVAVSQLMNTASSTSAAT